MPEIVRVLVVDDSAYVRKVVTQMLARSPFIEVVGTARDGDEALELVAELEPDVVTCDLNMPADGRRDVRARADGAPAGADRHHQHRGGAGEQVLAALDAGAVDFVQKPTALATERLMDIADELVEKVKAAALAPRAPVAPPLTAEPPPLRGGDASGGAFDIVVIGASTGGPQALKLIVPQLPADCPVPVAMVLHMPVGYTEMYAAEARTRCPRCTSSRRERGSWSTRDGLSRAGRPPPDVPRARDDEVVARSSTSGRSIPRTARRSTSCSSRRPRCTATACSAW